MANVPQMRVPLVEGSEMLLMTVVNNANHGERDRIVNEGATLSQIEKYDLYEMIDVNHLPEQLEKIIARFLIEKKLV